MRAARSASGRVRLVAALALGAACWPGSISALDTEIALPGCTIDAQLAGALVEPPELGRECGADAACWREGLERAREVRDRFAAAYDAHRAYVLDVRAAARVLGNGVIEEAAAEYRHRAEEHPDHPAYRHLLAQMVSEGEDYRRELDAVTREFPGYPWAHLSAAFLARGGFPEDLAARAEVGLERFVEICPERLVEIGRAAQFLGGADGAEQRLASLRARAVARGDVRALATLWTLTLRFAGEEGAETARARVASDLVEVESRHSVTDLEALEALLEAHRMAGDAFGAERIEERLLDLHPCSQPARRARAARYVRDFPLTGALPGADREAVDPRALGLVERTLLACPEDAWALAQKVAILRREPEASGDELVAAVDRLEQLGALEALGARWPELWQADLFLDLGIRSERVATLLEAGQDGSARTSDERAGAAARRERERKRLAARLAVARGELDRARAALEELAAGSEKTGATAATPAEEQSLDLLEAEIELAAGRPERGLEKLSACLAEDPAPPAVERWARRLWSAAHGGQEGFDAWREERSRLAKTTGPWRSADLAFPAIELRELGGGVWKIPDDEHRVLFLRSWAAWCGPCREEASVLEQLAAGFGGREDVLFAYLSVDASESDVIRLLARGEAPPLGFLVGGRSLLGGALPSVPTSWIVDGRGRIVAVQEGAATADPEGWLRGAREALLAAAERAAPPAE